MKGKDDNYELYRNVRDYESYFAEWKDPIKNVTEEIKQAIYRKYIVKCEVLKRDGYKCQNLECVTPNSPLTIHHVKAQRNGGEDKARNCLTLCRTCHLRYEKARGPIVLAKASHLPPKLQGHTFKLQRPEASSRWKTIKFNLRQFRKKLKHEGINTRLDQATLYLLMRWIFNEWSHSGEDVNKEEDMDDD